MEVKHVKNNNNKDFYFLVDDNGTIVKPVFDFILFNARQGKSVNTYKNQCHHLKLFFEWLKLNNLSYLDVVTKSTAKGVLEHLSEFRTYLKFGDINQKIVPINGFPQIREISSINQIMSAVISFYDFLSLNSNNITFNVYNHIRGNSQTRGFLSELQLMKEQKKKNLLLEKPKDEIVQYITRTQYNDVYKACNSRRDRIIIGLGFEGGLRISEICGLLLPDLREIHFNKIHITNREGLENPDAFVKYDSSGIVFIPDYLRDEIIEYITSDLIDIDTNYVFVNFHGKNIHQYMKSDTIDDMVKRVGTKAGINNLHYHMLRHGCAVDMLTTLAQRKEPTANIMVQIKDKLRHRHLSTTINTYAEFTTEGRKEIMQKYYENVDIDFTPDGLSLDDIANFLIEGEND